MVLLLVTTLSIAAKTLGDDLARVRFGTAVLKCVAVRASDSPDHAQSYAHRHAKSSVQSTELSPLLIIWKDGLIQYRIYVVREMKNSDRAPAARRGNRVRSAISYRLPYDIDRQQIRPAWIVAVRRRAGVADDVRFDRHLAE